MFVMYAKTIWYIQCDTEKKLSKVNACNSKDIIRRNMKQQPQERIYSQVLFRMRDALIILLITIAINILENDEFFGCVNLVVSNVFSLLNSTTQIYLQP